MIATRATTPAGPAAGTIARLTTIGRIAGHFTSVETAAIWATPGARVEKSPNPPQGMEAEVPLAATAAVIAALAATGTGAGIAALVSIIAIDAFAIGATNRAAVALALRAALVAATSISQKPATPG